MIVSNRTLIVATRWTVAGVVILAGTALTAQQQSEPQARPGQMTAEAQIQQRRFQFQLMEGILENAVRQGAGEVAMRARDAMPMGALFMGPAKAKGFPLDGYGIVFDVEVPIIRESAVIANQILERPTPASSTQPVASRPGAATTRAAGVVPDDPMLKSPVAADPFLTSPKSFYRATVREKLVDVMLDYSRSLHIPESEWLSIVARSEEDPMDAGMLDDESRTMILRVKGSDLALWHAGKLTREEARKRVVESQF